MYSIVFSNSAADDFRSLSKDNQQRVLAVLERIRSRPKSFATRLSGSKSYRIRVGDLRVILDIYERDQKILVLKIGNRENVYST